MLPPNIGILHSKRRIPILRMGGMATTKRINSKIARGSGGLAILSLLAEKPHYGFEIARQIGERTGGALQFTLASLYPLLYEMEKRGWVEGHWQANQAGRDRRYYRLTTAGRKQLTPLREEWRLFFQALDSLTGVSHA
jgi:PadR family transcriptional regulator, regulatory protein PadR